MAGTMVPMSDRSSRPQAPKGPVVHLIVLAGGRGERLGGCSKADLMIGGRRLLDRVVEGCRPVVTGRTVVVAPQGVSVPRWADRVLESPPGGGPAAGIAVGLERLREHGASPHDRVLVLSVDTPAAGQLVPELVRAVSLHVGCEAVVCLAGRPTPFRQLLQGCYLMSALDRVLPGGSRVHDRSVRALMAGLEVRTYRAPDELCRDVDTPQDVAWWEEHVEELAPVPRR